jgi:hypothetical protein
VDILLVAVVDNFIQLLHLELFQVEQVEQVAVDLAEIGKCLLVFMALVQMDKQIRAQAVAEVIQVLSQVVDLADQES